IINRDFADVKAIMAGMGYAVMGTATANGARRATDAAQKAIASPLLEAGAIDGARGILINITGSSSLKLAEVQEACSIIQGAAHEDANIIFGAVLDDKSKDTVKITVIATGFKDSDIRRRQPESRAGSNASPPALGDTRCQLSVPCFQLRNDCCEQPSRLERLTNSGHCGRAAL